MSLKKTFEVAEIKEIPRAKQKAEMRTIGKKTTWLFSGVCVKNMTTKMLGSANRKLIMFVMTTAIGSTSCGKWTRVMQSVHGNDYWQMVYDVAAGSWEITFNVSLDTPGDRAEIRRFVLTKEETSPG